MAGAVVTSPLAALPDVLRFTDLPRIDALGRPSLPTLHRWKKIGFHGVRLRTYRVGVRRFITKAALLEFIQAISGPDCGLDVETPAAQSHRRKKDVTAAEQELAEAGI